MDQRPGGAPCVQQAFQHSWHVVFLLASSLWMELRAALAFPGLELICMSFPSLLRMSFLATSVNRTELTRPALPCLVASCASFSSPSLLSLSCRFLLPPYCHLDSL